MTVYYHGKSFKTLFHGGKLKYHVNLPCSMVVNSKTLNTLFVDFDSLDDNEFGINIGKHSDNSVSA